MLYRRAEEARGDARDQPARRQPLPLHTESVAETGDHRAFSRHQPRETHPGDLLRGFLPTLDVAGLPGELGQSAQTRTPYWWTSSASASANSKSNALVAA